MNELLEAILWGIALGNLVITSRICHALKPFRETKAQKNRKLKYYGRMETMKVPTEIKMKRKDGTTVILKATKIIRKTPTSSSTKKVKNE